MTRRVHRLGWSVAAGVALLAGGVSAADPTRAVLPPAYVSECGSCHVAYPARLLGAASWRAVLAGLDRHFGVDASVDDPTLAALRAYLERSAGRKPTSANGRPLLRITETRWFRHEHEEVARRIGEGPRAVRASDCAACHLDAAEGRFSENHVRPSEGGDLR